MLGDKQHQSSCGINYSKFHFSPITFTMIYIIWLFSFTDTLDGKEISPTARQFLQNWKASKEAQKKRIEELEQIGGAGDTVDRPPVQPYSIGIAITGVIYTY